MAACSRPPRVSRTCDSRSGFALLWAVFLIMMVTTASFVSYTLSTSADRLAWVDARRSQAEELATATTEFAIEIVRNAIEDDVAVPTEGELTLGDEVTRYTIVQDGGDETGFDATVGMSAVYRFYRIRADAEVNGTRATVRRVVRATIVSAFQFAIFSDVDMFVYNQADTYVNGPVHCNADIYIYTFRDFVMNTNYVRAAGDYFEEPYFSRFKFAHSSPQHPDVRRWVEDPYDAAEIEEYSSIRYDSNFTGDDDNGDGDYNDHGDTPPFAQYVAERTSPPEFYNGTDTSYTMQTSEHGAVPLALPSLEDFEEYVADPVAGSYVWDDDSGKMVEVTPGTGTHSHGYYRETADLFIQSYENGSWKAWDGNGVDITADLVDVVEVSSLMDTYQAREAGNTDEIDVLILDMDELNDSGHFPSNGLLYLNGEGAGNGTDAKGFQLSNGERLQSDLTIVSPNSVYVQGDFNTDNKKSAAVMADAVHVLSNAWDGDKEWGDLPYASDTTYNMCVVTGSLEQLDEDDGFFVLGNLLRRHERWTDKDENFNGSLVTLGYSKYATGRPHTSWSGELSGGYRPPIRRWSFDEDLTDLSAQPPFAPRLVKVEDVVVF